MIRTSKSESLRREYLLITEQKNIAIKLTCWNWSMVLSKIDNFPKVFWPGSAWFQINQENIIAI